MRVLVSSVAAPGHLAAVLPLARAASDRGHQVAVAVGEAGAEAVVQRDLPVLLLPPPDERLAAYRQQVIPQVMAALLAGDRPTGDAIVIREVFGRVNAAASIGAMTDAVRSFEPDLVLCDPFESAAPIAALGAGLPVVLGCWGAGDLVDRSIEHLVTGVEEVAAAQGVDAGDLEALLRSAPRFSLLPPSLDSSDHDPIRWRAARPAGTATLPGDVEAFVARPGPPVVYATVGSVVGAIPPFLTRFAGAVLPGIEEAGVRCVLTVGRETDVELLGRVPPEVLVRPWLSHAAVMPRVELVLSHGGINTVLDAIAARKPQVVVPMQAGDQFLTGERLAGAGAATCLIDDDLTPDAVATAIATMLDPPTADRAVDALADELETMPDPHDVVDRLASGAGPTGTA